MNVLELTAGNVGEVSRVLSTLSNDDDFDDDDDQDNDDEDEDETFVLSCLWVRQWSFDYDA